MNILREITPLTANDCFTIFSREKSQFDFPLHSHEDMELNLILDAHGSRRIVGDHIGQTDSRELVLIGSNLPHGWFSEQDSKQTIREVTIQFHRDLFDPKFLKRNQMINLRNLLENSRRGILFSPATAAQMSPRILNLREKSGFDSILELLSILHDLSIARDSRLLSDATFAAEHVKHGNKKIESVFEYLHRNFMQPVTLAEVARIANMSEVSFSRFIKRHTGYSFVDNLNEIRLGQVTRLLIDTTQNIGEIAFKCGFNNMANFNRIFKSKKGLTPKEFRKNYGGKRIFI